MSNLTVAVWELENRIEELETENALLREIIEESGIDADEIISAWEEE